MLVSTFDVIVTGCLVLTVALWLSMVMKSVEHDSFVVFFACGMTILSGLVFAHVHYTPESPAALLVFNLGMAFAAYAFVWFWVNRTAIRRAASNSLEAGQR